MTGCVVSLQCQPTFISIFSYCAFWLIVIVCLIFKWRRGSLFDAEFKRKKREMARRKKLGLPLDDPQEEANADKVRHVCRQ